MHLQMQPQGDARQGMIAVEHHVIGVNVGDGVQILLGGLGRAVAGQGRAFQALTFFDLCWKERARFQKHQLFVVVTKSVFRLQVQIQCGADRLPQEGVLDFGEQISATDKKFNAFMELVQGRAQGVFECPGQFDHARYSDVHGERLSHFVLALVLFQPRLTSHDPS